MPGDIGNHRYQTDYILVKHRYRNSVKCCNSYPGVDAFTGHNLVAMHMSVKLKILQRGKISINGTQISLRKTTNNSREV